MSEFVTEEAPPSDARPHGHTTPMRGDLTQGPILKTLLLFSIPTLLSNLLQTLNGTVNSIWVGKLIGESALAATANVNIIMFLMMATVFGFGMATTVRVGQSFGAVVVDVPEGDDGKGRVQIQLVDPPVTAKASGAAELGAEVTVRLESVDLAKGRVELTVV